MVALFVEPRVVPVLQVQEQLVVVVWLFGFCVELIVDVPTSPWR